MKKSLMFILIVVAIASLALAACGQQPPAGGGEAALPEPPAEYAAKTNPLKGDAAAASAGKVDYEAYCQSCHGPSGQGDGPAGASLDPKPGKIAEVSKTATDGFLFWRLAEGGMMEPFNSSMPAWKDVLSEDQIWQIITYVQTFP